MLDKIFRKLLTKRFLSHTLFWSVFVGIAVLISTYSDNLTFWFFVPRAMLAYALVAVPVYLNLNIFIPKYLKTRKYWKFTFYNIFWVIIFSFLKIYIKLEVIKDPIDEDLLEEISTAVTIGVIAIIITSFLRFFRDWVGFQDIAYKLKEVENEKLEAELKILKGQLNPHFMFNTLNNIYSLSLDKADEAPEMILKLSDLLSYTLYDCKEDSVLLKDEIDFINNYINLEKIRLGQNADIDFIRHGNPNQLKLSPLLFIPFIENAFKHGLNQRPSNPFIKIELDIFEKNKINFNIYNSVNPFYQVEQNNASGIGIENIKKRLELLYPDKHELDIKREKEYFSVKLNLDLS